MAENRRQIFGTKRSIWVVGILLVVCLGGGVLFSKWRQPRDLTPGGSSTIPIANKGSEPQLTGDGNDQQVDQFGLNMGLSDGQSQPQTLKALPFITGEPLSPEEIALIFSRLPNLPIDSDGQTEFSLPPDSLPPPRPGNTIKESFPPLETEPAIGVGEAGPLQVSRFSPNGNVPIAPSISITFNQPMVPLGTLGDLAEKDVRASIDPSLPGTWRWIGTKTLTFEYDSNLIDRLPQATEYKVTVPAGTKSATGGILAEAVTWAFKTPPLKMIASFPDYSPQPLNPIIFVAFDQRIDPASVLETISVRAGNQAVSLVLATPAEIDQDTHVSQWRKDFQEGRWIAFRAVQPLPAERDIEVTIEPGTASAEGPLKTTEAQSFQFSTYAPLRLEEHRCSWNNNACPPLAPFYIRFNNPLDTNVYREDMLRVEPEIPGVSADVYGDTISISGETRGQTTYTVTVSGKVQDSFGQQLGRDLRLTFRVGSAESVLVNRGQYFLTLDPMASKKIYSVYAINYAKLNLKIYAVQPSDWTRYTQYLRDWQRTDIIPNMPGRLVADKALNLNLPADTLSQVDIDLNPYMDGSFGHFVVVVEPPIGVFQTDNEKWKRHAQTIITWVQITQIGLDAYDDQNELVAWATDLRDGSPLPGVQIRPGNVNAPVLTDAVGVARLKIPAGASYLVAGKGADQAILARSPSVWYDDTWTTSPPRATLRWYVFDDRQMYRPGEEVHFKGWVRNLGGGQGSDVGLVGNWLTYIFYKISDPQGNSLGDGRVEVNALGGFDLAFTLPQVTNLGTAQLYLVTENDIGVADGLEFYHPFQIQEFRRPEYEVNARNETTGPYFVGDQATLAVEVKYYAGGGLSNSDVTWQISTSPGSYSPPNWHDFTFGTWEPWWYYDEVFPGPGVTQTETFTGKTDASGTHYLELDLNQKGDSAKDPQPQSVVAQATVTDVNRQAWSSTTTLLVHPADEYVGLRSDVYFVGRGTPIRVDFIVTDLDGKALANRPVEITAGRLEWKLNNGAWGQEVADVQNCSLLSKPEPDTCSFETPLGGSYQITAIVTDELGRKNQSRFTRWVSGGQTPPSRNVEQEQVTLIPDRESYQPGDTAHILVQSPFTPAEGLLKFTRGGILYATPFQIKDGTATLTIPIVEESLPNLNIQVDLAGSALRTDERGEVLTNVPRRPAYATGQLNLSIPPLQRKLSLQVTPGQNKLEPGGETTLTVLVKDANGNPVSDAELAVVVVDEAILALTNYQLSDPLSAFYADRPWNLSSIYGRASIILADPLLLTQEARQAAAQQSVDFAGAPAATEAPAASEAPEESDSQNQQAPINVRSDFNPLATFAPTVRTSSNGEAHVLIQLPDNLTRYRVMVVAVDGGGNKFGSGESNITARLPLMVRPSAPRFLNFGDKFELPVVLQNQTDQPMTVDVAARATNLEFSNAGLRVTVPANDRIEVRFPASTVIAGTTRVQVAATSGDYADAAVVDLPVYTPATSEAFATYGVIDDGTVAQPILYPSGVFPQYGGLEVTTSSTALQALTDAVLYLTTYPYECSDQLASRILTVSSLRDVLTAFKVEGMPTPAEMESSVSEDIELLQGLQNSDGGFPYWRRGFESIPFNTIHVAHALVVAGQKGFDIPAEVRQNALTYLREIEIHYPNWYEQDTRWTLSAYALYVRNLSGDRDAAKAEKLVTEAGLENLSMEAIGWLWSVIDDESQLDAIRLFINNQVVETAGAANFTTAYSDQTYLLLSSDHRTDAILLDALIEDDPQSDLIPKLVNGLLAHRIGGRWENIQENVFVLLTLDRYFNTYEVQTPDFVARIWLGNTYAGSNEFRERTTDLHETRVPMNYVLSETSANGGTQDLILGKDGIGRLYYRLGLRYAPTDLHLDPLDMGFVIQRTYEGVDDPTDVSQDKDGVWHIKAGTQVRIKITMVADSRRYHVALVDPIPAGLEIVNPVLAVSQTITQDPTSPVYFYSWWSGTWYEHQNMRDDRAEAFASLLWDGVYEYSYIARATTPGTFIVPPAKAEEMYSPEVFGRSANDWVIVEVK